MKRSQLGQLAASFANGELTRPTYEHRRRELIDGITSGHIQIARQELVSSQEVETTTSATGIPHSFMRVSLAASAVVVLLLLIWLVAPSS